MDAFQHVNNTAFLTYLEEARVDFLFTAPAEAGITLDSGVVVARHEIDYRRPLTYRPEPVIIETWVDRISAASVRLGYEVKDATDGGADAADGASGGAVYASAASVLVPYDLAAQRPRRFTDAERDYLKNFLDEYDKSA
jgi:acyl-CoA thioester hydrolase